MMEFKASELKFGDNFTEDDGTTWKIVKQVEPMGDGTVKIWWAKSPLSCADNFILKKEDDPVVVWHNG